MPTSTQGAEPAQNSPFASVQHVVQTTPRADDPLAGVAAPRAASQNPAAGEVSHLLSAHADQVSDLPVPLSRLHDAPLLVNQRSPADFENYIAARTAIWKEASAAGDAPGRPAPESG